MSPSPLPYAAASPTQRQQALLSARHVLDVVFPHLSRAHWVAALDQVQPPLLVLPYQSVRLTHEGLAALAFHLAPAPPEGDPAVPLAAPLGQPEELATAKKQTYAVPLNLREQLANLKHPATQGWPRPQAAPARRKALTTYGAKADSLDGIPSHRFGEPRRNFPELEVRGHPDPLTGLVSYSLREGHQPASGWFAKNAQQVSPTHWFYHD